MLIAARGLNSADLPSQSFVNRHIVYTHGYGVGRVAEQRGRARRQPRLPAPATSRVRRTGITLSDGPPSQIYFAENLGSYVLTGAQAARVQLPDAQGATDQFTRYKGKDGVKLSNFVRRAAFALRFGDLNPLSRARSTRTRSS